MLDSLSDEMWELNDYSGLCAGNAQFCQYLRTYLTEVLVVVVTQEQDFQGCRNGNQQGAWLTSPIQVALSCPVILSFLFHFKYAGSVTNTELCLNKNFQEVLYQVMVFSLYLHSSSAVAMALASRLILRKEQALGEVRECPE